MVPPLLITTIQITCYILLTKTGCDALDPCWATKGKLDGEARNCSV